MPWGYPSPAGVLCPGRMLRWLLVIVAVLVGLLLLSRLWGWARWQLRRAGMLHLVLSGSLPDQHVASGVRAWLRRPSGQDLPSLLALLEIATKDPKIEGVLLKVEQLTCGLGRAEEVRAALLRLRSAGKSAIVYAEELGLAGYWVALGATSVRLAPTGSLNVSGVAMEFTLLEGALERAGVRAQLLARGKYKSMREMFTASRMSDENREMLTSLVTDLSEQLVERVAAARGKSPDLARAALDSGPFRADEAKALGLIDATQYWDELGDELGIERGKVHSLAGYRRRSRRRRLFPARPATVALLNITGNIRTGHDRQGPDGPRATGHQSFQKALRKVAKSPKVRAIVLRVDSPGGSALASDLMWRELNLASKKKPMLVSMVNVAASGGYYTSALTGVPVWASPTTLTGSIGVVGGKFEVSELLSKLGIGRETVASGPRANFYAATTPWSAEELAKVDRDIEASYRDFVSKMAEARGVSHEALERVAQGRVWTGRQALDAKLVDRLGGLWDVETALREQLSIPAKTPIRWVAANAKGRLWPRQSDDAELESGALRWLVARVPGLGDVLDLFEDLSGERLLALSLIYPRRDVS